jgi:hypothetical protein
MILGSGRVSPNPAESRNLTASRMRNVILFRKKLAIFQGYAMSDGYCIKEPKDICFNFIEKIEP